MIIICNTIKHHYYPIFQEDPFSPNVVAELLSREDETLPESLITWGKAVVKTF